MASSINAGVNLANTAKPRFTFREKLSWTWASMKENKLSYLFVAPYYLLFFTFTILPVIISMLLSFTYYNILEMPKFTGWENYINLFTEDDVFLIAVRNTFVFAFVTGPLSYFMCLIFAWFINELSPKIRAVLTLIFYAPSISGSAYMIWAIAFSGDSNGYVNGFLMRNGFISEPITWFQNPKYMLGIIMAVQLWLSLGAGFLSMIAGLQSIDDTYYEAAAVDGIKNRFQELWYVTLPMMRPQLMFAAVMQIAASFAAGDICAQLAGFPSVDYAAHTVVLHMQDYGNIRFEMGYASAIATILFLSMLLTNKVVQNLLRKVGE